MRALSSMPSAFLLSDFMESSVISTAIVIGSVRAMRMSAMMNQSLTQMADAISSVPINATSRAGTLPL